MASTAEAAEEGRAYIHMSESTFLELQRNDIGDLFLLQRRLPLSTRNPKPECW